MNKQEDNNMENEVSVDQITQELEQTKDQLMRLMADFENYKRRTSEERVSLVCNASEKTVLEILPVVDNFERALAHEENENFQKIYENLMASLEKIGAKKIEVLGEDFDASRCDALMTDEGEANKVLEVFEEGYELNGKIIRHAKVKIGA